MEKLRTHLLSFCLGVLVVFAFYSLHNFKYLTSPKLHFADNATYQGPLNSQGLLEGYGKMTWPNGIEYLGEFKNGLFEGKGKYTIAERQSYEGQFHQGYMEGLGKIAYPNGDVYEGQFVKNFFEGKGKLTRNDRSVYEGDFLLNEITGKGKWTFPDKSVYSGEFKNGKFEGKGEWIIANGSSYSGDFVDGKMQGKGTYKTEEGVYTGDFANNEFTGKGSYHEKSGSIYEGTFLNWMLQGDGIKTDESGNQWKGKFDHGELEGEGTYSGKNGETYSGGFHYGQYSGQGKLHQSNGDLYEGEFKYGKKDGTGVLTYNEPIDGVKQVKGQWNYDRLVEGDETTKIYSPAEISEYAIYHQQAALNEKLADVKPSDPKKVELYSLVIAAYGTQEVFRRESKFIQNLFTSLYGNQTTSLYLTNSQRSLDENPLATLTSIKDSITRLSQQMDKENDIFFLYITSHGSKDKKISLTHNGLGLGDIDARWLGDILKSSGIKHKVIVLSACYSGGFIDELKDNDSVIMTSAAADRTSFGCGDDSHFTYFAKAYFKESLAGATDFVSAFYKAKDLVNTWETAEKQKSSNPQIYVNENVVNYLKQTKLRLND